LNRYDFLNCRNPDRREGGFRTDGTEAKVFDLIATDRHCQPRPAKAEHRLRPIVGRKIVVAQ
jgi:hypothetical protein